MVAYTAGVRAELQTTNTNNGTWGTKLNDNVFKMFDAAITNKVSKTLTSGVDVTLTDTDGVLSEATYSKIILTGTISATTNVIIPNRERHYWVVCNTSGSGTVNIKTASGTAFALQHGRTQLVRCNGSGTVVGMTAAVNSSTGLIDTGAYDPDAVATLTNKTIVDPILTDPDLNGSDLIIDADGDSYIHEVSDDVVALATGGTERLRVNASGNVGIATTTPSVALEVGAASGADRTIRMNSSSAGLNAQLRTKGTDGYIELAGNSTGNAGIKLFATSSGSESEIVRITPTGLIGIANASPSTSIEVGTAAAGDRTLRINSASASMNVQLRTKGGDGYIELASSSAANSGIKLFTSASGSEGEAVRITSGGDVGVGVATPSYKLDVDGDINASGDLRSAGEIVWNDANVGARINALTEDASPATGDFVATYDVSAAGPKKVALSKLLTTQMTESTATGSANIEFTSIPAGTRQITIAAYDVSGSSTANATIQIGDSGGFETTSYDSKAGAAASTSGYILGTMNAAETASFHVTLTCINSAGTKWVVSGTAEVAGIVVSIWGTKTLSAALDRIRLNLSAGTIDANGGINVVYQ